MSGHDFFLKYRWALGLFFCLALAACFATYRLEESPRTWFDEGMFIQVARNFSSHGSYVLRASPSEIVPAGRYSTVGLPVIGPLSLSFRLFGVGLLQARAVMVGFILLLVGAAYAFAYRAWGFRIAVLSASLMAAYPSVYGNGKNVLGEVPGLALFFLFLILVHRLERREGPLHVLWMGAGLTAGLFMATKPNFILLLPVLGLVILLRRKALAANWKYFSLGAGVLALPIFLNVFFQFGLASSAIESLKSYANPPGITAGIPWLQHLLNNAKLFVQKATPAYLLLTLSAWSLSWILRLRRKKDIPTHEWIAYGFSLMTGAYFLKMQGSYRYFFPAQIIAFPYAVAAAFDLLPILRRSWLDLRRLRTSLTILFVALTAFHAYQTLFNSWIANYYSSTRSRDLRAYFRTLDPSTHVFFYDAVEAVTFYPSETYSQYFPLTYYNDTFGGAARETLRLGVPDVVVMESSLEDDAASYLRRYRKQTSLAEGYYTVFTRK